MIEAADRIKNELLHHEICDKVIKPVIVQETPWW